MRLFIFGAGYSGRAIASRLANRADWCGGTTRSEENFSALKAAGLRPFAFDGERLRDEVKQALRGVTHLVKSIAPGESGDALMRITGGDPQTIMPNLKWAAYLSTVGVYGNHDGNWVDEETACRPSSKRSVRRVAAESQWLEFSRGSDIPVAVMRLSGIYGPGRNTMMRVKAGNARRLVKPGQVFNRIHVDDIAGAADHLSAMEADGIWNVTDDLPAPPQDVVAYACTLMGVEPPPEIPFETADLTPMARSFYGENKRVSNSKLKDSGYRFAWPDYKSAFDAMWRDGNWHGHSKSG
ncbi:MAG: SDR family oxidoreductase [Pseudomonadota bacterium]